MLVGFNPLRLWRIRFQAGLDPSPAHGLAVLLMVRQGVGRWRSMGTRGHRLWGLNVGFHFGYPFCVSVTCWGDGGGGQMLHEWGRQGVGYQPFPLKRECSFLVL